MTVSAARQAPAIPSLDPERFVDVDLFGADFKADVAKWFLEWAEKPPFYVMVDGRPNAVICRHEQVKAAFADYETFSVVPQPGWGADYLYYLWPSRLLLGILGTIPENIQNLLNF